jgi:glucose-6-phosphate-specific signal transduction histidine kinase
MTKIDKIINDLDKAIASLDDPNYDVLKVSKTIQSACKFIVSIIDTCNKEKAELREELSESRDIIEALMDDNDVMRVDINVILEFMKKNGIDLTYIVTKSDIAKKVKKGKNEKY